MFASRFSEACPQHHRISSLRRQHTLRQCTMHNVHAPDGISAAELRSSKAHNSDQARWRSSAHCMAWFHYWHRIPDMTIKAHQTLASLNRSRRWVLAGLLLCHSIGSGVGVHFRNLFASASWLNSNLSPLTSQKLSNTTPRLHVSDPNGISGVSRASG